MTRMEKPIISRWRVNTSCTTRENFAVEILSRSHFWPEDPIALGDGWALREDRIGATFGDESVGAVVLPAKR